MKKVTKPKSLHAFLLTGVLLAACSNDDSVTEQRNIMEAGKTYYMSVEATKGSDEGAARATRALTYSDGELHSSWSTNDNVFLRDYDSNLQFASLLKPSNDGSIAWLNGTVTPSADIPNTGVPISVTLISPRKDWSYVGQSGTIKDINDKYDYATTPVLINSVTANEIDAASGKVDFQKEQAIVQFTLLNKNNNAALNPSSLRISASGLKTGETAIGDITITPAPNGNTNVIYAALRGINDISGTKVTLTATDENNKTYIYNKAGVTFDHGSFYPITVKMHEVTYPIVLTNVNNIDYIGSVVGTDGWVYAKASDVPAGQSAVAMIAYVNVDPESGDMHGLAVALTDENNGDTMNQSIANTAASSKNPVAYGTWGLPNVQDWKDMFIGCGGKDNSDCSAFNSKLATVGSALLSSYQYWTSVASQYLSVSNYGATPEFLTDPYGGALGCKARAVLFFEKKVSSQEGGQN